MIQEKTFPNGFKYLEIENSSATAKVALQGGHLFHYQVHGQEPLLWLSEKSYFETGKAIRGGVPICWPWFGKHSSNSALPQHGFARTSEFTLLEVNEKDTSCTELTLQLESSAASFALWPYHFQLQLHISIGQSLTIALTTSNCGSSDFTISSALHTYYMVSEIGNTSIKGLDGLKYRNFLTSTCAKQDGLLIINEEVDRVYDGINTPLTLNDLNRSIQISSMGSSSAVIWNPWKDKSRQINDMADDAYKTMLCIETAIVGNDSRKILAGSQHILKATIR
jgi:D-hexose-6-phosphate mutarotase